MQFHISDFLLGALRERAGMHDRSGEWPELDLRMLAEVGAMGWAVPPEFGGDGVDGLELHLLYERVASASLATVLVLTQRDSAVSLIAAGTNEELKRELLPRMARDEVFATVGIAQLTTSRQGGEPAVRAVKSALGWTIDGVIPWSTGAGKAAYVVAGAAVEAETSGEQILFALPTQLAGVTVERPMELVALRSAWTGEVKCVGVELEERFVSAGPMKDVMGIRKKQLPLGQAFLALGHARGAMELIRQHDSARGRALHARLTKQLEEVHEKVMATCRPGAGTEHVPQLRAAATDLALRAAHAGVTLYKGSALFASHPAQRLAREALFLLVWSCPDRVIECSVELLGSERI